MNTLICRSLMAAALIVTAPIAANAAQVPASVVAVAPAAATLNGPIQLNNVSIQPSTGWQNNFAYFGITDIAFTNHNASPATDVLFVLHGAQGQIIGQIEDVGSFAQGQIIRHSFTNSQLDLNQTVSVEEATFADGSVWTNPGPIAPISRLQAR